MSVASFRESWWHRSCPSDRAPHGSLLLEAPVHDDREEAVVRLALHLRLVRTRVGVGVRVGVRVRVRVRVGLRRTLSQLTP